MFGSLKAFGGEKSRTFSHKDLLFSSSKKIQMDIDSKKPIYGLEICSEWEKRIMTTQGKITNDLTFKEAFVLHPSSNPYNGNRFNWEYEAMQKSGARGGEFVPSSGRSGKNIGGGGKELLKVALRGGGDSEGGHLYSGKTGGVVQIPKLKIKK